MVDVNGEGELEAVLSPPSAGIGVATTRRASCAARGPRGRMGPEATGPDRLPSVPGKMRFPRPLDVPHSTAPGECGGEDRGKPA